MKLTWHSYRYYPYERELAKREAAALLNGTHIKTVKGGFELIGSFNPDHIRNLTYFSGLKNGQTFIRTTQDLLETEARTSKKRQATRYSVHGLHEYKGKFNPQVAKALLNIFSIREKDYVFDPFCGSGTTLVECAHSGMIGYGTDLNPLAVYVANAKLQALISPAEVLYQVLEKIAQSLQSTKRWTTRIADDARGIYLRSWFNLSILHTLEIVRARIQAHARHFAPIFLVIASNLLREYSQQDPYDLRIRRRKSPLPVTPFIDAFLEAAEQSLVRLQDTQSVLGTDLPLGKAALQDATALTRRDVAGLFDAAITSPPLYVLFPRENQGSGIKGFDGEYLGSRPTLRP